MVDSPGIFSGKKGETINLTNLPSDNKDMEVVTTNSEARILFQTDTDDAMKTDDDSNIEDVTLDA